MFLRFLLWRVALARPYVGVSADRPSYDATTASLLTSSEASFSFPTCFTRLTRASSVPTLAHPLEWACPLSVRLQSLFCHFTFLVLIGISTSLRVFSSSVVARPHLPRTSRQHSSHTGPLRAPQLPTPAPASPIIPPPPSVRISSLFREQGSIFGVSFQPSRVTGLQATSSNEVRRT